MEYQVFPNVLCLLHCVPLYVYRLCINFQDLCKATWNGSPSYSASHLHFSFVIDFLSIRKVIIFSTIATDDCHPISSRSVTLTLANGCNPTTSFVQAFQHANDIHSRQYE